MRTLAKTATGVLATAALILTPVLAGTSAAAPHKAPASHSTHAKPAKPAKAAKPKPAKPAKPAKPSKAKAKVVVVGIVSATQTVASGATSTVLIKVTVQGGSDKDYRRGSVATIRVTKDTVVKRNHGRKARYELRVGDKVTVHARRAADGTLTAFYVAASGRPAPKPVQTSPSSTSTATAGTHHEDDDDDRD